MPRSLVRRLAALALVCIASLPGCSDGGTGPGGDDSPTPPVLTASPLRLSEVTEIVSIGNLAPPGHTLPTEHAYLFFEKDFRAGAPLPRLDVFAPGDGVIRRVIDLGTEGFRVDVQSSQASWITYYLILVDLLPEYRREGKRVAAGERIGVTKGHANTLDLGVVNRKIRRTGFARPQRYGPDTQHIDSPFRYFAEPVRSQVYAKVNREGADKDGSLEVDVPGTLAGVWFRDDVPLGVHGYDAWSRALVFAPDVRRPSQKRVSIGNGFQIGGLYGVHAGARDFAAVTAAAGRVGYRLDAMDNSANPWRGVLVAQLAGADTLYVEFFPGSDDLAAPMTSRRTRYLR